MKNSKERKKNEDSYCHRILCTYCYSFNLYSEAMKGGENYGMEYII